MAQAKVSPAAVFLCGHVAAGAGDLRGWAEPWLPGVQVLVLPELCRRPDGLAAALAETGAARAVLGLCGPIDAAGATQAELRRAGLDPLGCEVCVLGRMDRPASPERLRLLLAAAVARARAFAGSKPEHARLRLSARLSRRSLFQFAIREYQPVPAVRSLRCAAGQGCTLCAAACPQGAIRVLAGRAVVDSTLCKPCGLCVAVCPRGAIVDPTVTPAQVAAEVSALLSRELTDLQPRAVLYVCRHDRQPGDNGESTHPGWLPVQVPCVGMLPVGWLLAPLLLGAAAVGVVPCEEAGRNDGGVAERVAYGRELLRQLGGRPDWVGLTPDVRRGPAAEGPGPAAAMPGRPADWFGPGGGSRVVLALARALRAPAGFSLVHAGSPVGLVEIHPDACTGCGRCALSCPAGALGFRQDDTGVEISFAAAACTACALCVAACPEEEQGAIHMLPRTEPDRIAAGREIAFRTGSLCCVACGRPIAPGPLLRRIAAQLGREHPATQVVMRYCLRCREGRIAT